MRLISSWCKYLMKMSTIADKTNLIEYRFQPFSNGTCINCTFKSGTLTNCVVVVHQRISQLSSSGLMNIATHKFHRFGDTASGCIEGVNLTNYQVGVIGGRKITPTTDPRGKLYIVYTFD